MLYCFFIMKLIASTSPDALRKGTVHQVRDKEIKNLEVPPKELSASIHFFVTVRGWVGRGRGNEQVVNGRKKP